MAIPTNIKTLLSGNVVEWARIEFKETWDPEASLKTVCAFANDLDNWGGGYIVVGAEEENGRPVYPLKGVPVEKIDAYQKNILEKSKFIRPAYSPIVEVVDYEDKKFIVLWCPGGDNRPYSSPKTMAIEDKISACDNKYIMTNTGFLDSHQQSIARIFCKKNHIPIYPLEFSRNGSAASTGSAASNGSVASNGSAASTGSAASDGNAATTTRNGSVDLPPVRTSFYGGYEDAERVILINMPDYFDLERDNPLCIIRAEKAAGSRELTHRDYLGSLLGLGLKRDMIGDIIVRSDGADIIVMEDIADFILMNYYKAGRTSLSVSRLPISELIQNERKVTIVTDTVASLRLDSVIASAFGLSRGKAAEAISRGIVFVNNMEVTKTDFQISEGDKLTLRGKGKAVLAEVGGRSRKDRQYITIERY